MIMEIKKMSINGHHFEFVCEWRSTRSGFAHDCTLFEDGSEIATYTCNYYNRTWECYAYQTVMKSAVNSLRTREKNIALNYWKRTKNIKRLTKERKAEFEEYFKNNEHGSILRELYERL